MNQFEHIDELIAKCLMGEASALERKIVEHWVSLSKENTNYYSDVKAIFEISEEETIDHKLDIPLAWKTFSEKVAQHPRKRTIIRKIVTSLYSKAAILIIMLTAGYLLVGKKEKEIILSSENATINETLPDGTLITLNPQSTLTFSGSFNKTNRSIKLTGRAYFRVHHNEKLPFIIHSGNTFIKDAGTAFKVIADPSDTLITVHVDEGAVDFYSMKNAGIRLLPNEEGTYNQLSDNFRKKEVSVSRQNSDKHDVLRFEKVPLNMVIDTLNKVYNGHIILSCKKLNELELTATFRETTLNPVIEVIAETFDLSVSRSKGTILLNNKMCND